MIIKKRRRIKGKTDYKSRKNLLKSGKLRLVFRRTNRYIIGQIVSSENAQDKVEFGITSKKLIQMGWPEEMKGSLKSLAAAYLTGYLLGKLSNVKSELIFDIGMIRNVSKSRAYAFLKGAVDAGIKVPHNPKIFPEEKIIFKDDKIAKITEKIKNG